MSILSKYSNKVLWSTIGITVLGLLAWQGIFSDNKIVGKLDPTISLMLEWHGHALNSERYTEGFRPPVAARLYAYSGLAAWEAAVPVLNGNWTSLAARYKGLQLPTPSPDTVYHLPSVLNGCYSTIFQKFFVAAPRNIEQERGELEAKWASRILSDVDSSTYLASSDFGRRVALAVHEWSATDTIGHMGNLHNYDRNYTPPVGDSLWQPCEDFPMPALLPHWGDSRTFVVNKTEFLAAPIPGFSFDPQSVYYVQALEVYTMNTPLSPENQWVAEFWSDDFPGLTFSSAGRWISISNQVIQAENTSPEKALETYLRVGLSLSDAAVACWDSKYHYNLLRPETYIRQAIKPDWRPIVHTPSFPAYPSGHAMFSAAAAEVLTQLYGPHFKLTDTSHKGRKEFKGKPRHYHSFYEMAFENAASRIALGVHYRMDCDEGTRLGLAIGKEIAKVPLSSLEQ